MLLGLKKGDRVSVDAYGLGLYTILEIAYKNYTDSEFCILRVEDKDGSGGRLIFTREVAPKKAKRSWWKRLKGG